MQEEEERERLGAGADRVRMTQQICSRLKAYWKPLLPGRSSVAYLVGVMQTGRHGITARLPWYLSRLPFSPPPPSTHIFLTEPPRPLIPAALAPHLFE